MRNDLKLLPWEICSEADGWNDDFLESVFFLGNGRMGVRGYLPFEPDSRPTQQGLFLAGIFGEIKDGITDFVNLPSPVCETLLLNGTTAVLASPIHRTLDLKSASFYADFTLAAGDTRADVRYTRFFPKELPALLMQRFEIHVQSDVELELRSGINLSSCNSPIPDDQVKENTELVQLAPLQFVTDNGNLFSCTFETVGTGLRIEQEVRFYAPDFTQGIVQNSGAEVTCPLTAHAAAGQTLVFEKLVCIRTSRDADERIAAAPSDWSFRALWDAHTAAWLHTWQDCDRTLPDAELQTGLRYSMFQLMASCAAHDPTVSIGARGLTHARYKGCYFWDTDLFMLPFFLKNDKTAAKNLCLYRANALDAARDHAKKMNAAGARYPWMAALDGSEQCETWDIGCSEVHITADVAYALGEYCRETGDEEFYLHKAAPVFIETARFWASRYTWNRAHTQADLMFCKGPDEYCGITRNNLFTNVMVQHNLELAIDTAKALQGKSAYQNLGLSEEETASWQTLHDAIPWPHDPDSGHLAQDETFHLLEPVDIAALKPDLGASYHHVCFDRLQRYKVVKQADVLLLMTRLPELFTKEEKMQAWNDFEPLCLHDSTLSFASHALFALQNGLREKGIEYLRKALLLDLRDLMNNTGKEGLHLAGMGEGWQAACLL